MRCNKRRGLWLVVVSGLVPNVEKTKVYFELAGALKYGEAYNNLGTSVTG